MSALIASWLTPASLFLILNIMIGTIFLISRLSPHRTPHHQQFGHDDYNPAPPLQRAPSLLNRVKSINFLTFKFPLQNQDIDHHLQPENLAAHQLERAPSILERVKSINFSPYKFSPRNPNTDNIQPTEHDYTNPQPLSLVPALLERVKSIDLTSLYRSVSVKSNQQAEPPTTEEADSDTDMSPVHGQVNRSKSESKVVEKEEEEEEEEEVERRRLETVSIGDGDQGVDAKADDFINKFKQQLKLQRLDSLLRFRDMFKGK